MFLKDAYNLGVKLLKVKQYNLNLETRLILQHILALNEVEFLTKQDYFLNNEQIKNFYDLISLRNTGYPMAYILGYKPFWKYTFIVDNNVLIPRPETETLIEAVLDTWSSSIKEFDSTAIKILDIGTGSGCILLSLMKEIPNSIGIGIDISKEALLVCKKNIKKLNINYKKVTLLNQDLFTALNTNNKFNIIVSNPPYIDLSDQSVQNNVKKYEPSIALFAKNNGLDIYKKIFNEVSHFLTHNGTLFLEIGINQKDDVINLNKNKDLIFKKSFKDYLNIDRVLLFVKQ